MIIMNEIKDINSDKTVAIIRKGPRKHTKKKSRNARKAHKQNCDNEHVAAYLKKLGVNVIRDNDLFYKTLRICRERVNIHLPLSHYNTKV
jgi:hypothetical protein